MFRQKKNIVLPFQTNHEMEPYSVIRRSKIVPLFHPYYINYGFNKVEMFSRLTFLSICWLLFCSIEFHYYVLVNEFCVDIPHNRTRISWNFTRRRKDTDLETQFMRKLRAAVYSTYGLRTRKWVVRYTYNYLFDNF